jgi:hypothetical protein
MLNRSVHPNNFKTIITGPGEYKTRNGKNVTIHEVKPQGNPKHMEFRAKGTIWKKTGRGIEPQYCIWHVSGMSRAVGIYGNDIVEKL